MSKDLEEFIKELNIPQKNRGEALTRFKALIDKYKENKQWDESFERKKARKWTKDLAKTAKQLADLLEASKDTFCAPHSDFVLKRLMGNMNARPEEMTASLRLLSESAGSPNGVPGAWWKGRAPDASFNMLVHDLALFYRMFTGKIAARSNGHDHYKNRQEEPGGPFFRLVSAAVRMTGESRNEQAISSSIKRVIKREKDHWLKVSRPE